MNNSSTSGPSSTSGGDAIASWFVEAQESAHWRETYASRPYVLPGSIYDDYGPAYALGEDARRRHADRDFDDIDPQLADEWIDVRANSTLNWDQARPAARDAWDRWARRQAPRRGASGAAE